MTSMYRRYESGRGLNYYEADPMLRRVSAAAVILNSGGPIFVTVLPVLAYLVERSSWRTASLVVAGAALAVVPLVLWLMRDHLGEEGRKRSVVVVSTSDAPALERLRAAQVATAISESFRDQGKSVLLLVDSITRVARAMKAVTTCDKLNIAALGNVVPQLHVHVIARFRSDAAWPKPVWGVAPPRPYDR